MEYILEQDRGYLSSAFGYDGQTLIGVAGEVDEYLAC
jgi:hypothetical protein